MGCKKQSEPQPMPNEFMYFPSNASADWETKSMASLGWNQNMVQPLKDYLIKKKYKIFYGSCKRSNSDGRIF